MNKQIEDIKKTLEYFKDFDEEEIREEETEYKKVLKAKEILRKPCDMIILNWLAQLE